MTEPLQLCFRVACPPEHAFEVWTARTSLWWPADHTVSGEDGLEVVIEPRVGGRIFERTASGREEDWGEVLAWEPPHRLAYLWHLRADRADATEVEIVFAPDGDGPPRSGSTTAAGSGSARAARRGAIATAAAGTRCSRGTSTSPKERAMADGTPESPWRLKTPSGTSEYEAWRDESLDPPALVVQVGKTQLRYHLRALDDLHAMLAAHGDWMPLGSADEQKPAADGTVEAWARSDSTRSAAGTG